MMYDELIKDLRTGFIMQADLARAADIIERQSAELEALRDTLRKDKNPCMICKLQHVCDECSRDESCYECERPSCGTCWQRDLWAWDGLREEDRDG